MVRSSHPSGRARAWLHGPPEWAAPLTQSLECFGLSVTRKGTLPEALEACAGPAGLVVVGSSAWTWDAARDVYAAFESAHPAVLPAVAGRPQEQRTLFADLPPHAVYLSVDAPPRLTARGLSAEVLRRCLGAAPEVDEKWVDILRRMADPP